MKTAFLVLLSVFVFSSTPVQAFENAPAAFDRQQLIDQEMDCVSRSIGEDGQVTWEDVCYTSTDYYDQERSRQKLIAKSLDDVSREHYEQYKNVDYSIKDQKRDFEEKFDQGYHRNYFFDEDKEDGPTDPDEIDEEYGDDDQDWGPRKTHRFDAGFETYYYTYDNPTDWKYNGWLYGFYGNYVYNPEPEDHAFTNVVDHLMVEGRYSMGKVDFTSEETIGAGSDDGDLANIDTHAYETRLLFGKEKHVEGVTFIPYFGLGYQFMHQDGDARLTTLNKIIVDQDYNFLYMPLGVQIKNALKNNWSFVLKGEIDIFLKGWQQVEFSQGNIYGYSLSDLEADQDGGIGARGSIQFIKKGDAVDFSLEPFLRFWNIDQSEEIALYSGATYIQDYFEPHFHSYEWGLRAGLQF